MWYIYIVSTHKPLLGLFAPFSPFFSPKVSLSLWTLGCLKLFLQWIPQERPWKHYSRRSCVLTVACVGPSYLEVSFIGYKIPNSHLFPMSIWDTYSIPHPPPPATPPALKSAKKSDEHLMCFPSLITCFFF